MLGALLPALSLAFNYAEMKLQLVKGTYCLDGSDAGYNYAAPSSGNSTRWVFFMQGGGACLGEDECKIRAKTGRGTSTKWSQTVTLTNHFFDLDASHNPTFADAHHVYIPYGTGDTHKGTRMADATSFGLYFTGHTNFVNIMKALEAKYNLLSKSTAVLLLGSSAGGVGALSNADTLAEMFTVTPAPRFKTAPDAGFFFPNALPSDFPEHPEYPPSNYSCFAAGKHCGLRDFLQSWAPIPKYLRSPGCLAHYDDPTVCDSIGAAYPFIQTPVFLLENQYDTNQIYKQQGCPKTTDPMAVAYIRMYGEAMRNSTVGVLKDGDGLFSPSCLSHGVSTTIRINGTTLDPVLTDWFWGTGKLTQYYRLVEECPASAGGLPCNTQVASCTLSGGGGGDGCQKELEALGCLAGDGLNACEKCAEQHQSDLKKAGCTSDKISGLCTA